MDILTIAHAIEMPSYVLVPVPAHQRDELLSERLFRMFAASFISTMNVDSPSEILSEAPLAENLIH